MSESELETTTKAGISRRRALATIGAGTAAVWAAPVVTTTARALAGSAGNGQCSKCQGDICTDQTTCGSNNIPPFGECPCAQRADGTGCFCYQDDFCSNLVACPNGQGDCPSGQVCTHTCCDAVTGSAMCFTPCGTAGPQVRSAKATKSGARGFHS